jgi:serine/threonine protein kinase
MTALPFPTVNDVSELYLMDDIYDFLGEGTFASVFKAVSLTTRGVVREGQTVALKVISKRNLTSDKLARDVINEAHLLRQANHPNCVRFIECVQTEHAVVLVTEYIEGVELFQALKQHKFTEGTVLEVMQQLLSVLAYLHDTLHIVHRDVKPENIMVDTKQTPIRVVLVDFGLARSCERKRSRIPRDVTLHYHPQPQPSRMPPGRNMSLDSFECDSPMLATPCGTLKYAAPETVQSITQSAQLSTTKELLPRLDVYAAGVIMYVMLSGALPFKNFANKANLVSEMRTGVTFNGPRWEGISADAIEVNQALLNFDPTARPRAAEALQHRWFKSGGMGFSPAAASQVAPVPCSPLDSSICERGAMTHAFEAMRAPETALYFNDGGVAMNGAVAPAVGMAGNGGGRTPNSRCINVPFGQITTPTPTTAPPQFQSNYFDFA